MSELRYESGLAMYAEQLGRGAAKTRCAELATGVRRHLAEA